MLRSCRTATTKQASLKPLFSPLCSFLYLMSLVSVAERDQKNNNNKKPVNSTESGTRVLIVQGSIPKATKRKFQAGKRAALVKALPLEAQWLQLTPQWPQWTKKSECCSSDFHVCETQTYTPHASMVYQIYQMKGALSFSIYFILWLPSQSKSQGVLWLQIHTVIVTQLQKQPPFQT